MVSVNYKIELIYKYLQVYRSHASVKFNKKIAIKTERDVEIRLKLRKDSEISADVAFANRNENTLIKTEHVTPKIIASKKSTQKLNWQKEKQTLVEKIVALKAENNNCLLDLKAAQSENAKLLSHNEQLNEKLTACNAKMNALDMEMVSAKANARAHKDEISELKSNLAVAKKEISNAIKTNNTIKAEFERERKKLIARVRQLETVASKKTNTEREYEVGAILKHKNTRNGHKYLIRWKNYGSDEDSWEREENLNCPTILEQYKKSKQK